MASIGWIDLSRAHRNRIASVLELLKPDGVVDELGIGSVRDAIANQLFPGISTIQTRARYFFFIPYILQDYQRLRQRKLTSKSLPKYLEDQENSVMWDLGEVYDHKVGSGVIGITIKRGRPIARKASTIYWNGIQTFNFILADGLSLPAYLKRCVGENLESLISAAKEGDDMTDDADAEYEDKFRIKAPYTHDWRKDISLNLTRDEAQFFYSRIVSLARHKLLSEVLTNGELQVQFLKPKQNFMDFAKEAQNVDIQPSIRKDITLAHDFSQLMFGVHIAYNCNVHNMAFNDNSYEEMFREWTKKLRTTMLNFNSFNPNDLPPAARDSTNLFIREWWAHAVEGFTNRKKRDELIHKQESIVKGRKARIECRKFDDVREGHWIGLGQLNYRFTQASQVIEDILEGLN